MVEELTKLARAPFRWMALDFSGHGDTRKVVNDGDKWETFAVHDIVTVLQELQGDSSYVLGIGHSLGGASLLLTELKHRGAFDRLALFEPVVLPHPDVISDLMGVTEEQWGAWLDVRELGRSSRMLNCELDHILTKLTTLIVSTSVQLV